MNVELLNNFVDSSCGSFNLKGLIDKAYQKSIFFHSVLTHKH